MQPRDTVLAFALAVLTCWQSSTCTVIPRRDMTLAEARLLAGYVAKEQSEALDALIARMAADEPRKEEPDAKP